MELTHYISTYTTPKLYGSITIPILSFMGYQVLLVQWMMFLKPRYSCIKKYATNNPVDFTLELQNQTTTSRYVFMFYNPITITNYPNHNMKK